MTIHLPENLESSIFAVVNAGRFASVDDAMAQAARLLLRELELEPPQVVTLPADAPPDPLLGVWRDATEEIDEIVADAMRHRREDPWRVIPGE
jgi:Arc/MetJ-type ribon-helix-helix transcriptional regulator